MDVAFEGRINYLGRGNIELIDIRSSDEGWYECQMIITDANKEEETNGTWVYLQVNCKYGLLIFDVIMMNASEYVTIL